MVQQNESQEPLVRQSKKRKLCEVSKTEQQENVNPFQIEETLLRVLSFVNEDEQTRTCKLVNRKWCTTITSRVYPDLALKFMKLLYVNWNEFNAKLPVNNKKARMSTGKKKNKYRPTNLVLPPADQKFTWNFGEKLNKIEEGNDIVISSASFSTDSQSSSFNYSQQSQQNDECSSDDLDFVISQTKRNITELDQLSKQIKQRKKFLIRSVMDRTTDFETKFQFWLDYAPKKHYDYLIDLKPKNLPSLFSRPEWGVGAGWESGDTISLKQVLESLERNLSLTEKDRFAYKQVLMEENFESCVVLD